MNGKISNLQQIASVRRYQLKGGREDGINVIDCDNGKIRFLLNESKALDMMQLYHEGQNVSFLSKNAFTLEQSNFLNRFEGGMIYTCGIDSLGRREGFEMHGTLHNQKAEVVRAECSEDGITVEAIIRNTELFGKNLVFKRKVFCEIGASEVTVSDTLINEGFTEQEYCLLYHVNLGYPMLDEGCKIEANIKAAAPANAVAEQNKQFMLEIEKAQPAKQENCYYLTLEEPKVSLINSKIKKKFTIEYSKKTLPYFLQWKSMASGDYALGLEPCTTEIRNLTYTPIKPNESVKFFVKLCIEKL